MQEQQPEARSETEAQNSANQDGKSLGKHWFTTKLFRCAHPVGCITMKYVGGDNCHIPTPV